jgi:hypothetical protein
LRIEKWFYILKKISVFSLILLIGFGLFIQQIESFFINLNLCSWTISKYLFKLILLTSVTTFSIASIKLLGNKKGILVSVVCTIFVSTCLFIYSPIYVEDFNKEGSSFQDILLSDTNSVLRNLNDSESNFKGVLCIVNADCKHCHDAGKLLNQLKFRNPKLDISILVFTNDSLEMNYYIEKAETQNFKHYLAKNAQDVFNLNLGSFPCFFYIDKQTITHRWFPEELGYPALDWIESM